MDRFALRDWWRSHATWRTAYLLFLGQVVSFVMALMSFTSSLIADLGVDTPLTQTLFGYFVLALVYGNLLLYRRQRLKVSWYWYLILGFVDVQGNYLVNKAYQFSSITSVTLLDCWTVAWVIVLTWFFLGTRYSLWQLFGVALCVLGLGLVLLSDAGVGGGGGSKPLLGDILVIAGTIFYAFSNVGEEFCVKKKDRVEVICMIGVYGFLVSVVEISVLELKSLESVEWSMDIILSFFGYTLATFMFYSLVPFVLKLSGATMFNLSILTSDMWAVVIKIFFYKQQVFISKLCLILLSCYLDGLTPSFLSLMHVYEVLQLFQANASHLFTICVNRMKPGLILIPPLQVDWLYYLAFAIVVVGLILYSTTEKNSDPAPSLEDGNSNAQYQVLSDESEGSGSRNETLASTTQP